ncbi:hypothetical protein CTheo_7283 [Ceratobasidium theobromae]|uniref:O-FucT domain containing protein n=1 Tax=Ceratobasidium theobromae TaxID=1582974 RepID=A0A5N5QCU1_9AGAM|nr:hypothetical protein CTheo_7283 [Ceratobasidium theobromae]
MESGEEGHQVGYRKYPLERRPWFVVFFLQRRAKVLVWVGILGVAAYLFIGYIDPKLADLRQSSAPVVAGKAVVNRTTSDETAGSAHVNDNIAVVQPVRSAHSIHSSHKHSTHSADTTNILVNDKGTVTFGAENLLPSTKYITGFHFAGFTNQVMEVVNLIYLALLTNRVPIVPAFYPTHLGSPEEVASTRVGDIFDLPYLSSKLGTPIIEWHQLKRPRDTSPGAPLPPKEKLGCWSLSAGNNAWSASGGQPTESYSSAMYDLDISYTPIPPHFTLTHGVDPHTNTWSVWALAALSYPESRAQVLREQSSRTFPLHDGSGEKLEPDDHLLCFDLLYYTGVMQVFAGADFFADYSPFWNQVAIHMRWKKSLVRLANQYLRRHFAIEYDSDPIPPFISVHVRRADFKYICSPNLTKDECFAPISAYHRRVQEIKERLRNRPNGVDVQAVLVTSDEQDPGWWDQVAALGPEWRWIDHKTERTAEKYGDWFTLLLDAVFQSLGKGFVGTSGSTMSQFALKRVEAWNDGEVANVQWGTPGADNH